MAVLALAVGCGSSPEPTHAGGPPAAMVATANGADDVIVAEVGGRPVWGSCVAAQIARAVREHPDAPPPDRQTALRECIDFELLAQAAEARGLAIDPEVVRDTKRALVSRFVEVAFERTHGLDDMAAEIDKALAGDPLVRREHRNSAFLRVEVADTAPVDVVVRGQALADKIHRELADKAGLFKGDLEEVAKRLGDGSGLKVTVEQYDLVPRGKSVKEYDDALFAIPEIGRVSPVTRTKWGFDIILLTDFLPQQQLTRADIAPQVHASLRARAFDAWIRQLVAGARVERDDAILEAIDREERTP